MQLKKRVLFGGLTWILKTAVWGLKCGLQKKSCELPVVFSIVRLVSLRHGSPLRAMTTHKRGVYTRGPLSAGRGRGGEGVAFPLSSPVSPPWGEYKGRGHGRRGEGEGLQGRRGGGRREKKKKGEKETEAEQCRVEESIEAASKCIERVCCVLLVTRFRAGFAAFTLESAF